MGQCRNREISFCDTKTQAIRGNWKFPDMRALADHVHAQGLKFGVYNTVWMSTYAGYVGGSAPTDKFKAFLKSISKDEAGEEEFSCIDNEGSTILTNLTMSPATYDGEPCTQVIFKPLVDD